MDAKEMVIIVLEAIKIYCMQNGACALCPFNMADKYGDKSCLCMFAGDDIDVGVIPEDWDLSKLEKEDDCDGC